MATETFLTSDLRVSLIPSFKYFFQSLPQVFFSLQLQTTEVVLMSFQSQAQCLFGVGHAVENILGVCFVLEQQAA